MADTLHARLQLIIGQMGYQIAQLMAETDELQARNIALQQEIATLKADGKEVKPD